MLRMDIGCIDSSFAVLLSGALRVSFGFTRNVVLKVTSPKRSRRESRSVT